MQLSQLIEEEVAFKQKMLIFVWYIIIPIKICVGLHVNYKLTCESKSLYIPRIYLYFLPEYCTHFYIKKRHAWFWESRVYVRQVASCGRSLGIRFSLPFAQNKFEDNFFCIVDLEITRTCFEANVLMSSFAVRSYCFESIFPKKLELSNMTQTNTFLSDRRKSCFLTLKLGKSPVHLPRIYRKKKGIICIKFEIDLWLVLHHNLTTCAIFGATLHSIL